MFVQNESDIDYVVDTSNTCIILANLKGRLDDIEEVKASSEKSNSHRGSSTNVNATSCEN